MRKLFKFSIFCLIFCMLFSFGTQGYNRTLNENDVEVRILYEEDMPLAIAQKENTIALSVGIINSGVNMRKNPTLTSEIILTIPKDENVVILSEEDKWYYITYEGKTGYVYKPYIESKTEKEQKYTGYGVVDCGAANIRLTPSDDGEITGSLYSEDIIELKSFSNGWFEVDGGYIRSDLINTINTEEAIELIRATEEAENVEEEETNVPEATPQPSNASSTSNNNNNNNNNNTGINDNSNNKPQIQTPESKPEPVTPTIETPAAPAAVTPQVSNSSIVETAKSYLGIPYVWGGTTPSGFDCSGFTQYVFKQCGYSINRIANDQMSNGSYVSYENLQAGDLVFFEKTYTTTGASHVGIYIGNGEFIHCAGCVKISSLSESYYSSRYYGARRVG